MFRDFFHRMGIGHAATPKSQAARDAATPYATREANFIYNLLFCDDPSMFKPRDGKNAAQWQTVLFEKPEYRMLSNGWPTTRA